MGPPLLSAAVSATGLAAILRQSAGPAPANMQPIKPISVPFQKLVCNRLGRGYSGLYACHPLAGKRTPWLFQVTSNTSSSAPASTACRPPGTWARTCARAARAAARTSWSSTRPAIAAGASGIACGVVRNNYFQPAMRRLMAHSVSVWESDPEAFCYHPVGYMQISPEVMHEDVASIYKQQKEIGYPSVFIEGEKDCMTLHAGPVLTTGRPRASPRSCTRRRAATPTTRARSTASPRRRRTRACAS